MPNLFAGRIGAQTMRANRLRLCFSSLRPPADAVNSGTRRPGHRAGPCTVHDASPEAARGRDADRHHGAARGAVVPPVPSRPCARTVATVPGNTARRAGMARGRIADHLPNGLTEPRARRRRTPAVRNPCQSGPLNRQQALLAWSGPPSSAAPNDPTPGIATKPASSTRNPDSRSRIGNGCGLADACPFVLAAKPPTTGDRRASAGRRGACRGTGDADGSGSRGRGGGHVTGNDDLVAGSPSPGPGAGRSAGIRTNVTFTD